MKFKSEWWTQGGRSIWGRNYIASRKSNEWLSRYIPSFWLNLGEADKVWERKIGFCPFLSLFLLSRFLLRLIIRLIMKFVVGFLVQNTIWRGNGGCAVSIWQRRCHCRRYIVVIFIAVVDSASKPITSTIQTKLPIFFNFLSISLFILLQFFLDLVLDIFFSFPSGRTLSFLLTPSCTILYDSLCWLVGWLVGWLVNVKLERTTVRIFL